MLYTCTLCSELFVLAFPFLLDSSAVTCISGDYHSLPGRVTTCGDRGGVQSLPHLSYSLVSCKMMSLMVYYISFCLLPSPPPLSLPLSLPPSLSSYHRYEYGLGEHYNSLAPVVLYSVEMFSACAKRSAGPAPPL